MFGSKRTIRKLEASLAWDEIEVVGTSDVDEMHASLQQDRFDAAAVNGSLQEAGLICNLIRQHTHIPIVLVVDSERAQWDILARAYADGYISAEASGAEVAARLQAVLRRWPPKAYTERNMSCWQGGNKRRER